MHNKPAIFNAFSLLFVYICLFLDRLGLLGKNFDIIFLPALGIGMISQIYFLSKSLIKKREC